MTDSYTWTQKGHTYRGVVRIPYYLPDGSEHTQARIRTNLAARHGSAWEGKGPLIPYGLHWLTEASDAGYCWIVEGESDVWTLRSCHLPALGIPGATHANALQKGMLDGIARVYIMNEPGQAGECFPVRVVKRLRDTGYAGECLSVSLHTLFQAKDPNELLKHLWREGRMSEFSAHMQAAREAAHRIEESWESESDAQRLLSELEQIIKAALATRETSTLYALGDRLACIGKTDQARLKSLIRDDAKRCPGFSWRDFNALLKDAQAQQVCKEAEARMSLSGKPHILLGRQLNEETLDCLDALHKANLRGTPRLFVRNGKLCQIVKDEHNCASIDILDEDTMIAYLAEEADFVRSNQQQHTHTSLYPTPRLAKQIFKKWKQWKFPPLVGLTDIPILRPDGTILDKAGYDQATGLYYEPASELHIPPLPLHPTRQDALRARDNAFDFLSQFPYAGQADRANACALFLSSVLSEFFDLSPMAYIDAATLGSGKSLLAQSFSLIVQGHRMANIRMLRSNEKELRKQLTAKLSMGCRVLILDTIHFPLHSGILEEFLTDTVWTDRLCMTNTKMLEFDKKRVVTLVTGNHLVIKGALSRRCFRIRLDAGVSHPWERAITYRHDLPLPDVARHRGDILAALLTMARAWYLAGQPLAQSNDKADFGQWKRVMGGILQFLDITGFLGNEQALYDDAAPEEASWELFLQTWRATTENAITVKELVERLQADPTFCDMLPEPLARHYHGKNGPNVRGIGYALSTYRDMPFGQSNSRLIKGARDTVKKQDRWKVVTGSTSRTPTNEPFQTTYGKDWTRGNSPNE